jgi:UDP-glucose:(heptosyl)LPS alpha-1,3-glucosyltransferase
MRVGIDVRTANALGPGQQRYLWRLGEWLGSHGHDVSFLTVRPQPAVTMKEGTTLHQLAGVSHGDLRRHVASLELDALLLNPERARRYRGIRANVLRSGYGTDHYRQKLRSFPGFWERALRGALRVSPWELAERRWERAFYEMDGAEPDVIAQSAYMKREIMDTYRVREDHMHVVLNGVDTTEFSPERRAAMRPAMREKWGIAHDTFCLLFIGHNFRLKGLWQLLRVLSHARSPATLLVAGRGTGAMQRGEAHSRIRRSELGSRVVMAGAVPSLEAYAAADAVVHLTWHDAFGFVVLEAMACGLPVVTTRYAGASELITNDVSGLLVDPADDAELARAVASLAGAETRSRIGTAAATVGATADERTNFRAVEQVFETAVARGRGPVR